MILTDTSGIRVSSVREPFPSPAFRPVGDERSATFEIWAEAGFLPPRFHRCIVDLLHYSMMEDEIDEDTVVRFVSSFLEATGYAGDYTIRDPARLRRIAVEYGVLTGRRSDEAIARDVTRAVIDEYGAGV